MNPLMHDLYIARMKRSKDGHMGTKQGEVPYNTIRGRVIVKDQVTGPGEMSIHVNTKDGSFEFKSMEEYEYYRKHGAGRSLE